MSRIFRDRDIVTNIVKFSILYHRYPPYKQQDNDLFWISWIFFKGVEWF